MISGKFFKKALLLLPVLLTAPALMVSAALTGQQIYDQSCAGCHSLGAYDTSGSPNLLGKGTAVTSKFTGGQNHRGVTLAAADITSVAAFVNNPTPAPAPVAISTTTLAGGLVGSAYSQTLAAGGGKTPYTWSVSSGALPAGLTLSSSGVISGTPTAAGSSSFTVKVTDSSSPATSATKALSITIAAAGTPLSITTSSLAGGTVGAAYNQTLAAGGGTPPYTWSYSGTLPPGVVVSSAGTVSGTPTTAGTYSFTVLAADAAAKTATQALSITVGAATTPMSSSDKTLFVNNCLSCHTPSGLQGRTAAQISAAIAGNVGGMGTSQLKALTSSNITAIARTLTPTPKPAWNCNTCHGSTIPSL